MPASLPRWSLRGTRLTTAHQWLKGAFVAAALLGGAGLASLHFVERPVLVEHAPAPGKAASRLTPEQEEEREQCVKDAFLHHDVRWAAACMVVEDQYEADRSACLRDPAIMANPQLGKAHCDRTFAPPLDGSVDCDLPEARAASLNAMLREAEQECRAAKG